MISGRIRKITALMMAAVLTASVLGSCAGKAGAGNTDQEAALQTPAEVSAAAVPAAAEENSGGPAEAEGAGSAGAAEMTEERTGETDLKTGDTIAGFTYQGSSPAAMISSEILRFTHEKSGAELVYVKNEDPELGFGIFYNTPMVDELDSNHVLEHSILAGSDKYPATNAFFDLANKTYNTFANASTAARMTSYELQSVSQQQLMKMADVYLSCMVAPVIAKDPRIFEREAIRRQLYAADGEILQTGTVYSEDMGCMPDIDLNAFNNVLDTLYPGEYASQMIGRAFQNYKDLTYEKVVEAYRRAYHFDNCLILLYGDMEYRSFMEFIDREYLDQTERYGTDLSAYKDPETPAGYAEAELSVPAYTGDVTENASVLDYAVDLDGISPEEILDLDFLSSLENNFDSSVLKTVLREHKIYNPVSVSVSIDSLKPLLRISLRNADPSQKEEFLAAVKETFGKLASEGENEELIRAYAESARLTSLLSRNMANAASEQIFPNIALFWSLSGAPDYYAVMENALSRLESDPEGFVRNTAERIARPRRSVYVASVPKEGLADAMETEISEYLAQMKDSMDEEQIAGMMEDTEAFDAWNQNPVTNKDFLIPVSELPQQKARAYEVIQDGGDSIYYAAADSGEAGQFRVLFDTGGIANEDKYYLKLYGVLTGMLPTEKHSLEEIEITGNSGLSGFSVDFCYPGEKAGENSHPCMAVDWCCRTGNLKDMTELIREMLAETDFSDTETVVYQLGNITEMFNPAKADANSVAARLAYSEYGNRAKSTRYALDLADPGFYPFLAELCGKLKEDPAYGTTLQNKMREISAKLLRRGNTVILAACPKEEKETVTGVFRDFLGTLDEREAAEALYRLPAADGSEGVAIDSAIQCCYCVLDMEKSGFEGRHLPFIQALGDLYTTPLMRFQKGAYSAASSASLSRGLVIHYTYSDPNVAETLDVFAGSPEFLETVQINREELDGYILNMFGAVTAPSGMLADVLADLYRVVEGTDLAARADFINDIKNAQLSDQADAAAALKKGMTEFSTTVTAGNEEKLRAAKDRFPRIISYR